MPDPGDQTDFGYYGLKPDEQSVKAAARAAALRGQGTVGLAAMLSGYEPAAMAGKYLINQSEQGQKDLGGVAKSVLTQTLEKQQHDETNAHAEKEYQRQVKHDADTMALDWAKLHDERAKEKGAPKYELKPGIGPNGEPMWVDPKDPTAAPMPVAAQSAVAADPAKQRQMALARVKDADARKTYDANRATLAEVTRLRDKIASHPDAFNVGSNIASFIPGTGPGATFLRKSLGREQDVARIEKGNQDVFNNLGDVTQKIVRARAGLRGESSAMVQDKIAQFLPQRTDTHQAALSKIDSYKEGLQNDISDFEVNFNIPPLEAAEKSARKVAPSAVEQRAAQYLQGTAQ